MNSHKCIQRGHSQFKEHPPQNTCAQSQNIIPLVNSIIISYISRMLTPDFLCPFMNDWTTYTVNFRATATGSSSNNSPYAKVCFLPVTATLDFFMNACTCDTVMLHGKRLRNGVFCAGAIIIGDMMHVRIKGWEGFLRERGAILTWLHQLYDTVMCCVVCCMCYCTCCMWYICYLVSMAIMNSLHERTIMLKWHVHAFDIVDSMDYIIASLAFITLGPKSGMMC